MHDGRDDRVDIAKRRQRQSTNDEEHSEQEVLIDHVARAARKPNQKRQALKITVHQRHGRAVNGHFTSGRAHGDAHVSRRQRRRIVHAVAHDRNAIAACAFMASQTRLCSAADNQPPLLRSRFRAPLEPRQAGDRQ